MHFSGWRELAFVALAVPWAFTCLVIFGRVNLKLTEFCMQTHVGIVIRAAASVAATVLAALVFALDSRRSLQAEQD